MKRADATKDNMGLTAFEGAKVRKKDVDIAKNYLNEEEMSELNRVVTMYLDFAEDQARRHIRYVYEGLGRKTEFLFEYDRKRSSFWSRSCISRTGEETCVKAI